MKAFVTKMVAFEIGFLLSHKRKHFKSHGFLFPLMRMNNNETNLYTFYYEKNTWKNSIGIS